uniref:Exocyst complex component 7 n=1 Tax=Heterorhabditis bacteriophora TaxID=37862 RepID=A0A1I7XGU2_HETBA
MKDAGYKSIVSAVILNHQSEKDKTKCIGLLDQLRDINQARTNLGRMRKISNVLYGGHCPLNTKRKPRAVSIQKKIAYDDVPRLDFEDLLEFTRTLYEWDSQGSTFEYLGDLSDCSFALLHCPVHYFNIPREVLKIITLSIFLVWDSSIRTLDEQVISRLINQLKNQQNIATKCEMLKTSLIYLSECVQSEMNDVLKEFTHESLFPPKGYHVLKKMNLALKTVVDICVLSIWDVIVEVDPSNRLTVKLTQMIRETAIEWITQEINSKTNDPKVERTISLDNGGESAKYEYRRPLPTGLYSFLCIQKGLSDDYAMLSFNHPEHLLMGVMSLVHRSKKTVVDRYYKVERALMRTYQLDPSPRLQMTHETRTMVEMSLEQISGSWNEKINSTRSNADNLRNAVNFGKQTG